MKEKTSSIRKKSGETKRKVKIEKEMSENKTID